MEHSAPTPSANLSLDAVLEAPLRRLQQRVYARLPEEFRDVRKAHNAVFRHLTVDGLRLTDLAKRAGTTKQNMAALISYLQKRGYVSSTKHPTDSRAILVKPTAKGERFMNAIGLAVGAIETNAAYKLGSSRLQELRQLLAALDEQLAGN